ncbi:oxidoreductase [Streptomyces qinzhouensis]|uniref:Oxidoreductase n=1 Tax=Streptomyces qinzhouensis TaxID=2599401 RepID=A0A5B8JEA4_9ACTN|nr:oxidoreductase [Streptomyces qinzhouensis]QDY79917.1 oxidoreductase [Streptomyces qinzhouensis]
MFSYDELTAAERQLWDAFPEGRMVDLRTGRSGDDEIAGGGRWRAGRTVRASVIVALLLGANTAQPGAVSCLRLAGARITGPLLLGGAQIAYALSLDGCWFEESLDLAGASTQSLVITGSRLPGLEAGMTRIEGRLDLRHSRLEAGSATSLHRKVTALSLINARVSGAVNLGGAELTAPGEWAVSAGGLVAEGGVYCLDGFVARGEIRLMGAQLPGGLHMRGAQLADAGRRGVALNLDSATASTLDFSGGFTAEGTVRLRGTRISDNLTFDGAVLNGPPGGGGPALAALRMQAVDFGFTPARPPSAPVDLRGAQVSYLHEGAGSWPDVVLLDGFVYGSVADGGADERADAVGRRVAWIRRGPGYYPQPYEQLAGWYRKSGHDGDARRVLLAKQRHRRATLSRPARIGGQLLDATVGYGYRPWLAGVWLLALTLLGTVVFGTHSPTPAKRGEGAPFQPLVYTLDLLIPIGGLGQRTAWYWPEGGLQGLAYALIACGWVLTTAVIAGVTRTLQKG